MATLVLLVYILCIKSIQNRFDEKEIIKKKDEKIEAYEADMDEPEEIIRRLPRLSFISHLLAK